MNNLSSKRNSNKLDYITFKISKIKEIKIKGKIDKNITYSSKI